jgi:hypothetical protein
MKKSTSSKKASPHWLLIGALGGGAAVVLLIVVGTLVWALFLRGPRGAGKKAGDDPAGDLAETKKLLVGSWRYREPQFSPVSDMAFDDQGHGVIWGSVMELKDPKLGGGAQGVDMVVKYKLLGPDSMQVDIVEMKTSAGGAYQGRSLFANPTVPGSGTAKTETIRFRFPDKDTLEATLPHWKVKLKRIVDIK